MIGSNPFRNKLEYWMGRVAAGEEVVITRHGKPRIRLSPVVGNGLSSGRSMSSRQPGSPRLSSRRTG
ncbi:MAG: type II toxin-antitoxin system Phd/YefM family antitoxin [Solirubrobacteraceae bacterium]